MVDIGQCRLETNMGTDLEELRETLRTRTEQAQDQGEVWVDKLRPEFEALPKGTVVAINCATGEYVLGQTRLEAADAFERRFGHALGWVHEVGGGVFLGGGIV
jgi:hypothetical protein